MLSNYPSQQAAKPPGPYTGYGANGAPNMAYYGVPHASSAPGAARPASTGLPNAMGFAPVQSQQRCLTPPPPQSGSLNYFGGHAPPAAGYGNVAYPMGGTPYQNAAITPQWPVPLAYPASAAAMAASINPGRASPPVHSAAVASPPPPSRKEEDRHRSRHRRVCSDSLTPRPRSEDGERRSRRTHRNHRRSDDGRGEGPASPRAPSPATTLKPEEVSTDTGASYAPRPQHREEGGGRHRRHRRHGEEGVGTSNVEASPANPAEARNNEMARSSRRRHHRRREDQREDGKADISVVSPPRQGTERRVSPPTLVPPPVAFPVPPPILAMPPSPSTTAVAAVRPNSKDRGGRSRRHRGHRNPSRRRTSTSTSVYSSNSGSSSRSTSSAGAHSNPTPTKKRRHRHNRRPRRSGSRSSSSHSAPSPARPTEQPVAPHMPEEGQRKKKGFFNFLRRSHSQSSVGAPSRATDASNQLLIIPSRPLYTTPERPLDINTQPTGDRGAGKLCDMASSTRESERSEHHSSRRHHHTSSHDTAMRTSGGTSRQESMGSETLWAQANPPYHSGTSSPPPPIFTNGVPGTPGKPTKGFFGLFSKNKAKEEASAATPIDRGIASPSPGNTPPPSSLRATPTSSPRDAAITSKPNFFARIMKKKLQSKADLVGAPSTEQASGRSSSSVSDGTSPHRSGAKESRNQPSSSRRAHRNSSDRSLSPGVNGDRDRDRERSRRTGNEHSHSRSGGQRHGGRHHRSSSESSSSSGARTPRHAQSGSGNPSRRTRGNHQTMDI